MGWCVWRFTTRWYLESEIIINHERLQYSNRWAADIVVRKWQIGGILQKGNKVYRFKSSTAAEHKPGGVQAQQAKYKRKFHRNAVEEKHT